MPKSSRHLPLSLECRSRLAQIQAGAVVVVDEGGWTSETMGLTLLRCPPVSLSFPPKNPLWKSVCVPDTSLTAQTSLTGRESLNFTSALVTDGARTARAPQGT